MICTHYIIHNASERRKGDKGTGVTLMLLILEGWGSWVRNGIPYETLVAGVVEGVVLGTGVGKRGKQIWQREI